MNKTKKSSLIPDKFKMNIKTLTSVRIDEETIITNLSPPKKPNTLNNGQRLFVKNYYMGISYYILSNQKNWKKYISWRNI